MVLNRDKLKKLLKEKGVKSLDDFNAFMRDVSKDVIETLLEEELTDLEEKIISMYAKGMTTLCRHLHGCGVPEDAN